MTKVAVTSRSFSSHPLLRSALLSKYAQVSFNETKQTLKDEALIQFLRDHELAIIGLEKIDKNLLSHLPDLKVISRFGVGIDMVDLSALQEYQVRLSFTKGANKRSVAELVIAFAIMMLRHLPVMNGALKMGVWEQRKGRELTDKTIGIVGLGAVGKELAILLNAFNCRLLCFDLLKQDTFCQQHHVQQIYLDELLQQSDIISLHLPLTPDTINFIDSRQFKLMKKTAIFINTARGSLMNEKELYKMLIENFSFRAACDVFCEEPLAKGHPLLSLPNFFATPHIGGSTEEAILAMGHAAIKGLEEAIIPKI